MKRLATPFFWLLIFGLARVASADLPADVRAVLADKALRKSAVGVEIVQLGATPDGARTVFSKDAVTPLIPASNLKLVTTAAFIDRMGKDFKFRTTLLAAHGDLALIGSGDPALGDLEYLKTVNWGVTTVYENWADQLKRRGVTSVRDVVVDDSIFDESFVHPRWPTDQLHKYYEAQVGGVNLNVNCVELLVQNIGIGQRVAFTMTPATDYVSVRNGCVGGRRNNVGVGRAPGSNEIILAGEAPLGAPTPVPVTIHDPPLFAATVLAETLRAKGITVTGNVRRDRTIRVERARHGGGGQWRAVAIHETPLSTILARTNKDSVNVYAESLCKRLGAEATGESGSWENGTAAVAKFLDGVGIDAAQYRLDDGCGLSKANAISAHALVRVMTHEFYGADRDLYLASLAVGGVDGTLDNRFRATDLRGRVFGKSGYVNGVRCLSGYVRTKGGEWYTFAILMNKVFDGGVKDLQDRIVRAIDVNAMAVADVGD